MTDEASETTAGKPQLIAVEGPAGVGKSAFCQRLARALNYRLFLETPETNPFLDRFHRNRRQAAFQTQLHFLLDRAGKMHELRQRDLFVPPNLVSNFIIEKDRIYAEVNLEPDELRLYKSIYDYLTVEQVTPDLVVYLQAPADWLISRLNRDIDAPYIEQLVEAYTRFFHFYDACPLVIVNVPNLDTGQGDADLGDLLGFIRTGRPGRHYYNPGTAML